MRPKAEVQNFLSDPAFCGHEKLLPPGCVGLGKNQTFSPNNWAPWASLIAGRIYVILAHFDKTVADFGKAAGVELFGPGNADSHTR